MEIKGWDELLEAFDHQVKVLEKIQQNDEAEEKVGLDSLLRKINAGSNAVHSVQKHKNNLLRTGELSETGKGNQPFSVSFLPGKTTNTYASSNGSGKRGFSPIRASSGMLSSEPDSKDASLLIIKEEEEPLTEEDVQLYQIRRRFSDITEDRALHQMECQIPLPVSLWEEADVHVLSIDRLFLQLGNHLGKGQISDTVRKEMIILSGTDRKTDSGMKLLYLVFTLLQGNPSRDALADAFDRIGMIPPHEITAEGVRIMGRAIQSAVADQDARNMEKDRNNRSRQAKYNRERKKAEQQYESSRRRADRWR